MMVASQAHMKAIQRTMQYCLNTPNRGILLQRNEHWDGNPAFEFTVSGKSDSYYAKDPDTRHSASGGIAYLCRATVFMHSAVYNILALSVTNAELVAAGQVAQYMLFVMRLMESIGLKVKKPMISTVGNKGTVDLINNWNCGGRTRHMDTIKFFKEKLKRITS
jgi:hypothetical protein